MFRGKHTPEWPVHQQQQHSIFSLSVYLQGKQLKTPNSGPAAPLQLAFFIFNASVISSVLILQPFSSSPVCHFKAVTWGAHHAEWIKHKWQEAVPERQRVGATRPGTQLSRRRSYSSEKTEGASTDVTVVWVKSRGLMKTHIPPQSHIAETWPNLLAFYQQVPSGFRAPEECGLPLAKKKTRHRCGTKCSVAPEKCVIFMCNAVRRSAAELCREHEEMFIFSSSLTALIVLLLLGVCLILLLASVQASRPGNPHTMCVHVNISQS